MKKIKFISLLLLVLISSGANSAEKTALQKLRHSNLSERDFFQAKARLFSTQSNLPPTSPDTLTLNVMAIRVEFKKDTKSTTTGDGKFDLSINGDQKIDPPPHNRAYFESQLHALSNYFRKVSNGKLIIKGHQSQWGDVFPVAANRAYQLPHYMEYYGPDEDDQLKDKRLAELFRAAFVTADTCDQIDFSKYDCFIVFHAGVGSDFVLDYDETPNDVSSAFLNLNDLRENLDAGAITDQGIPVSYGAFHIQEGIILPETQSQIGLDIGLLGTAAILFGSQIGLPNLFNTENGRAGIGVWGLMDQGSGNYQGLIPAQPCAWSKIFLGWEQPIPLLKNQTLIRVAAALAKNPNKIYKIPINANEYFLIENRQRHVLKSREVAIGYDENGVKVELEHDGTIMHAEEDTLGVIVSIDEYDFGLPWGYEEQTDARLTQPGILIWHIDESIIREKFAENKINADPGHRGVNLMEAHGAKDLGQEYGFLHPAGGSQNGIIQNAFWDNNESHKTVNSSDVVAFTPSTRPSSRANSGADSHIYITNFSKSDSVMTFNFRMDLYQPGFPQPVSLLNSLTDNSLICGDVNGNDSTEIFATAKNGKIFSWKIDGSPLLSNEYFELVPTYAGKTDTVRLALFAAAGDSILKAPLLADLDGDDDLEIIAVTKAGKIYAWQHYDNNGDGLADVVSNFPVDIGNEITAGPLVINQSLVVGTVAGAIVSITDGAIQWQFSLKNGAITGLANYGDQTSNQFVVTTSAGVTALMEGSSLKWTSGQPTFGAAQNPVVGDLNHDSYQEIYVSFSSGKILAFNHLGYPAMGFTPISPGIYFSAPALGDLDGDGFGELVIVGADKIFAYHHNGRLVENFPVSIIRNTEPGDFQYGSPVLGDIDGDRDLEIIVGSPQDQIVAFHHTGDKVVYGFPLSTGAAVQSSVALLPLGLEAYLGIAAIADDGQLYVWQFPDAYNPKYIAWRGYLNNAQHTAQLTELPTIRPASGELMPVASVYNYPNPTEGNSTTIRYELNAPATVTIKIYDLSGELVAELDGPGEVNAPNEITWQLDNIRSGVYFARVEANGNNSNKVTIIKIAVVK